MKNECCPALEELNNYFSNITSLDKRKEIEEHFLTCDECIDLSRSLSLTYSNQRITKANILLGKAWKKYGDAVEAKAAGDFTTSIKEFITKNGKYKLTLRPLQKNSSASMMEIEVFDPNIKGQIKVSGNNKFSEVVEIDKNNSACILVGNNVDLSRIIITEHNQ